MKRLLMMLVAGAFIFAHVQAEGSENMKQEMAQYVENFDAVDQNLYRGSYPDRSALLKLKELGIKTIVNFRHEQQWIEKERSDVETLGLKYISIPWTIWGPYNPEVFPLFLDAIKDRNDNPVYFHCRRGSERTGVISSVYKMKFKGMSFDEGVKDAKNYHLKLIWKPFVIQKIKQYAKTYMS